MPTRLRALRLLRGKALLGVVVVFALLLATGVAVAIWPDPKPTDSDLAQPSEPSQPSPTIPPSSSTVSPTTTSRPAPAPSTTIEPIGQVFADDFSRSNSGWRVLDTAAVKAAYADGGYRVTVLRGNGVRLAAPVETRFRPTGGFPNDALTIEAKVTFLPASVSVYAGLNCRGKTDYQGYRAHVRGDGYWSIFRFDSPEGKMLDQAKGASDYAKEVAGAGPHQLRLDCLGRPEGPVTLALYVNGFKLAEVTDAEALPPGLVNLSVSLSPGAATETAAVVFDDFLVSRQRP